MILRLPSLARDERGTSLIEFGFLAPFLAILAMGVIDLSRGLAERFAIQQAVNRSLELIQARPAVGSATANDVDYAFVKAEAAKAGGVEPEQVTVTRWLECDGIDAGAVNGTCDNGEAQARYLRVRIEKEFDADFYFDKIPMSASGTLRTQ